MFIWNMPVAGVWEVGRPVDILAGVHDRRDQSGQGRDCEERTHVNAHEGLFFGHPVFSCFLVWFLLQADRLQRRENAVAEIGDVQVERNPDGLECIRIVPRAVRVPARIAWLFEIDESDFLLRCQFA